MDAKDLAATARKALRAATKKDGDVLHGLTVSVRVERASMCTEIAITITGVDEAAILRPEDERDEHGCWTVRAREISDRVHELAADAVAWSDGRMRFTFVYFFSGLIAPNPRTELEIADAALASAAAEITDEQDAEHERRNAPERAELAADTAGAAVPAPRLADLPACRPITADADAVDAAARKARQAFHIVTDSEADVIAAATGHLGEEAKAAAVFTLELALQHDWIGDRDRLAREMWAVHAVILEERQLIG
jgi:hypothetical protein